MVVGTGLAVTTLVAGGRSAAAALGSAVGATGAIVSGIDTLGIAIVIGALSGAIVGARDAGGAVLGAAGGAFAAAGIFSASLVTSGDAQLPVGWIVLGTEEKKCQLTFDCWKSVLHDTSPEPSQGMLIRDVVRHPNIASVIMETSDCVTIPHIVLENVWREKFDIQYFLIKDTGRIVAHANKVMQ